MAVALTPGPRVLVVGESWIKHTVHMKGFDQFQSVEYEEGGGDFLAALAQGGAEVTYIRAHEISARFPTTAEELAEYDVVVLSDVGANSFLLCDETFLRSQRSVNRLVLLADFVRAGGGLLMVGGYMSFTGIDGRARFGMTPLAEVLPVVMLDHDDRVEAPEGVVAEVLEPGHPLVRATTGPWPPLLGYNRLIAKPEATVVVSAAGEPLLACATAGAGRTVAFASDCAPHWAPPEFVEWPHYSGLWTAVVQWLSGPARDGREPAAEMTRAGT